MARPEAQALAGFYATPTTLLGRIAALVEPCPREEPKYGYGSRSTVSVLDPCAGDGEALVTIAKIIAPDAVLYGCELEATRHKALELSFGSYTHRALQGDAFRIAFAGPGAGLLYLNPPYDHDPEHVRLEQRWLARFTPGLRVGGVLLFVVPHYALEASADFVSLHYDVHGCFRFPAEEWGFKQCVLVATRVEERMAPDTRVATRVRTWAAKGERLRVLPEGGAGLVPVPSSYEQAFTTWKMGAVDYTALAARYRPWGVTGKVGAARAVDGMEPGQPLAGMLLRTYPLATPPRPAHIAAGISSGIFNGARIEPNEGSPLTSPLLVKGVFDREYKTVDEKTNKAGEVTALVQVQQPKLVVTALDLETHEYRTLGSGEMLTQDAEHLTVSGLLQHYGDSLMRVMRRQCPVLHDSARDKRYSLPRSPRRLFRAQHHAVTALLKLLARNPAAVLLGEIGSGKSTVALSTARAKGCTRPLVLCPPHLLQSWKNEVASVYPGAGVHVLSTVQDVQDYAALPPGGFHVAVLSREAAKLGHAWAGAEGPCPRCGTLPASPPADLARKRARCAHRDLVPADRLAVLALEMAERLMPYAPEHHAVTHLVRGRHAERRRASAARGGPRRYSIISPESVVEALSLLAFSRGEHVDAAVARLLHAVGDDALTAACVRAMYPLRGESNYENLAVQLACLVADDGLRAELQAEGEAAKKLASKYSYGESWNLDERVKRARDKQWSKVAGLDLTWDRGPVLAGHPACSLPAALDALYSLAHAGAWHRSPECGEPLFQAVPEPRRVALSGYIARYFPRSFDFLVLDEGHEYASDTSAQSFAGHRLSGLGKPTLLMTGTIMNGYAESLFVNMWALSPAFRAEFSRDDKQRFVDRYGYRKRIVEERVDGSVVAYGSQSDRVERSERQVGNAPGVLPLFLLRHLLPVSVTLHKADLAIDLPPLTQEVCKVDPGPELAARFERLKKALVDRIKSDRFREGLAGKLWGQLAELPSYLDRATADVGNCDEGDYEVRYPEGVLDGRLVASECGLPAGDILPKERWLLDLVDRELAEGRNVMVFAWHTKLLPRLRRLLESHVGSKVPYLDVDKVGTAKRQAWIDANVVRPGARVMVANPVAVQTGLNNLVHFATEVWMENPACNPVVFRQAVGRVDRIGQRLPTRVFFPVYAGTLQEQLHGLLAKKVAVSVATDGLDPEQALLAAGVGESDALAALSIGRQLWSLMGQREA